MGFLVNVELVAITHSEVKPDIANIPGKMKGAEQLGTQTWKSTKKRGRMSIAGGKSETLTRRAATETGVVRGKTRRRAELIQKLGTKLANQIRGLP